MHRIGVSAARLFHVEPAKCPGRRRLPKMSTAIDGPKKTTGIVRYSPLRGPALLVWD
jgi:hypothetical protein